MHDKMIGLPDPDQNCMVRVLVNLERDVRQLRFDPTITRARFTLDHFQLRRRARLRALLYLLGNQIDSDSRRDWRAIAMGVTAFAADVARVGLSTAAADLSRQQSEWLRCGTLSCDEWARRYDTFGAAQKVALAQRAAKLAAVPLISLVVPVYPTPERWLRRCLDSGHAVFTIKTQHV